MTSVHAPDEEDKRVRHPRRIQTEIEVCSIESAESHIDSQNAEEPSIFFDAADNTEQQSCGPQESQSEAPNARSASQLTTSTIATQSSLRREGSRRASICQCELTKKHQKADEGFRETTQRVVDFVEAMRKRDNNAVYKFQVAWDPAHYLKHRLPKYLGHHVLIAPYQGSTMTHLNIIQQPLPAGSPFIDAIKEVKIKCAGVKVITGFWKEWSNPLAILFDVKNVSRSLAKACREELKKDFNIDVMDGDTYHGNPLVFGYVVARFLIEFELSAGVRGKNISPDSRVRFSNWDAAPGLLFFVRKCTPIMRVTFVLYETSLGELEPKTRDIAEILATEVERYTRFLFEKTALRNASDVVVVSPLTVQAVSKQLQCGPPVKYTVYEHQTQTEEKLLSYFRASRHKETKRVVELMVAPVRECYIHTSGRRNRRRRHHEVRR